MGGGHSLAFIQSVRVYHSLIEKLGGEEKVGQGEGRKEKKEIADPEVRGQGSNPDHRSTEEVSARQPSTCLSHQAALWVLSCSLYTTAPCISLL